LNGKLEKEAKKFRESKTKTQPKQITARIYLAGQAMAGLLSNVRGTPSMLDIKREAYDWADYMLDDEK
tara:strand:- start:7684 stop:7887 length:204 start_codon:yes stop_codon:yes gene_type:complete